MPARENVAAIYNRCATVKGSARKSRTARAVQPGNCATFPDANSTVAHGNP